VRFFNSLVAPAPRGKDTFGIPRHEFGHDLYEIGRIEPGVAQLVELSCRRRDGDRAVVRDVGGSRQVWRQTFGKGNVSKVVLGVYRGSLPTPSHEPRRSAHSS
jgi:hypothetical protein